MVGMLTLTLIVAVLAVWMIVAFAKAAETVDESKRKAEQAKQDDFARKYNQVNNPNVSMVELEALLYDESKIVRECAQIRLTAIAEHNRRTEQEAQLKREQALRIEREVREAAERLREQAEFQAVRERSMADIRAALVAVAQRYRDKQRKQREALDVALAAPTYEDCLRTARARGIERTPEVQRRLKTYFTIPTRAMIEVEEEDYERNNEVDRNFVKKYKLRLLGHFGNKCACCGRDDNGVDVDHYFIPKAKGGNFILKLSDGRQILNAVPMCESCNRSKGKRTIEPDMEIVKKLAEFQKMM
jgi:5-methylcytosine-specific restriction endonuclease McrA